MLACSAPPSVESSASVECDPRSRSSEVGDSSGGCSRSRSSRSRLSRVGGSWEGQRCARSRSGGSRGWSRESRSCSMTRSWSHGLVHSHWG